jgi:small subunit ribosomal protein S8
MTTVTDPIADMFTRIRNACMVKHEYVYMPFSTFKLDILKILKQEGFIDNYEIKKEDIKKRLIKVNLKYSKRNESIIKVIQRVSRPGARIYLKKKEIGRTRNGYGMAIVSTSKGMMTDRNARMQNTGGEIIGRVY